MDDKKKQGKNRQFDQLVELKKLQQGELANMHGTAKRDSEWTPTTRKGKILHFFYCYKWVLLLVLFLVGFVTAIVVSTVNRERFDLTASVAVSYDTTQVTKGFERAFGAYTSDFDDDGEVKVFANCMTILGPDGIVASQSGADSGQTTSGGQKLDFNYDISMKSKLMGSFQSNNSVIFLVDDGAYAYIHQNNESKLFETLSDVIDGAPDGDRFYIKGTPFAELLDIANMPDDLSLCFRYFDPGVEKKPDLEQLIANSKQVLQRIVDAS